MAPLMKALPVSHRVDGEISGESFVEMKMSHCDSKYVKNAGSLKREIFKRQCLDRGL